MNENMNAAQFPNLAASASRSRGTSSDAIRHCGTWKKNEKKMLKMAIRAPQPNCLISGRT